LRVPAWCADARLTVNGALLRSGAREGYLRVTRTWRPGDVVELTLAMPPRLISAHPRVDAVRGSVALARGPVVYCLEHADTPAGVLFEDLEIDPGVPVTTGRSDFAPVTLRVPVRVRADDAEDLYRPYPAVGAASRAEPVIVTAIPYFLWANRAPGPMRVWIPVAPRDW
jgi:DUF1680 family protein